MSYRPTIGGKLREETSRGDRSQAVSKGWGLDPLKQIGQTCGFNVVIRRVATSYCDRHQVSLLNLEVRPSAVETTRREREMGSDISEIDGLVKRFV